MKPPLPPLDPQPAPLHPRYGGIDDDDYALAEVLEEERRREQWPAEQEPQR